MAVRVLMCLTKEIVMVIIKHIVMVIHPAHIAYSKEIATVIVSQCVTNIRHGGDSK